MRAIWTTLAGTTALIACTQAEMPQAADGRELYKENCAMCHGIVGHGDGPIAADLEIAPKDLTTIAERRGGNFPRAEIMSLIDGYTKSDRAGPNMPEFGGLLEGDLVPFDSGDGIQTPTPRKLVALLEYLESIQSAR